MDLGQTKFLKITFVATTNVHSKQYGTDRLEDQSKLVWKVELAMGYIGGIKIGLVRFACTISFY
jgi:hypothetical protein